MATLDVGKLRQVLDYWSCETCLDVYSPEQDYLCGVCARLNREVLVKKAAVGFDEAVQVIPPEDFNLAKGLRERSEQQEVELAETRARFTKLQAREAELEEQVRQLQEQALLAPLPVEEKRKAAEDDLVSFDLVGVRKEKPEELLEFAEDAPAEVPAESGPAASDWEGVESEPAASDWERLESEPAALEPEPEVAAEEATEEAIAAAEEAEAPEMTRSFQPIKAPRASPRAQAADDALERIESEIGKIEEELAVLAAKERELVQKSGARSTPEERAALRRTRRRSK